MILQTEDEIKIEFLKQFTEEILAVIKLQKKQAEHEKRERDRIGREIEVEKLKRKYLKPEVTERTERNHQEKEQHYLPSLPEIPKPLIQKEVQKQIVVQKEFAPMIQPTPAINSLPFAVSTEQMPFSPAANAPMPQLNLGKIIQFVRDPSVTSIECPGPEKEIIIKKNGQIMTTDVKLNKEEIDSIITDFSEKARIPLIEGLLRARVANLQISAVVSKIAESRFIITKMILQVQPQIQQLNELRLPPQTMLQRTPMQMQMQQPIQQPRLPQPPMPPINRPFVNQNQNPNQPPRRQ